MGAFSVEFEIGNRGANSFRPVVGLVDTGSAYTLIPAVVLREIGAEPEEEREFVLADGRHVSYGFGWVDVRLGGQVQPSPVIFGDDGSEPLLGVVTLEIFSLAVDPVNQTLIRVPALLKGTREA
jgi:clan AA aspartic protease